MQKLREKKVENLFIKWLNTQGYNSIKKSGRNDQYDIYAKKGNIKWWFEVKGCPKSEKTLHQQMVHYFQAAIAKIICVMEISPYKKYGIVFPDIGIYERKILKLKKEIREKISICFYMIDECGKVKILKPSMDEFRKVCK